MQGAADVRNHEIAAENDRGRDQLIGIGGSIAVYFHEGDAAESGCAGDVKGADREAWRHGAARGGIELAYERAVSAKVLTEVERELAVSARCDVKECAGNDVDIGAAADRAVAIRAGRERKNSVTDGDGAGGSALAGEDQFARANLGEGGIVGERASERIGRVFPANTPVRVGGAAVALADDRATGACQFADLYEGVRRGHTIHENAIVQDDDGVAVTEAVIDAELIAAAAGLRSHIDGSRECGPVAIEVVANVVY